MPASSGRRLQEELVATPNYDGERRCLPKSDGCMIAPPLLLCVLVAAFPAAVDEALAEDCALARLNLVAAEPLAQRLECVSIRIGCGLLASLNGRCLAPMFLGSESPAEFARAVRVHKCQRLKGSVRRSTLPFWRSSRSPT